MNLKNLEIRTVFIISLIALLFLTENHVLAQNPDNADTVTKTILAQKRVVEENLINMKSNLGNLQGSPYQDSDYDNLAIDFKKRVDEALTMYDQGVNQVILPKAQYWLNRFAANAKQKIEKEFLDNIEKDVDSLLTMF
jgi:hypothetical protein